MDTGKVINKISNRLRRRSVALQEKLGMSGAQGNILNYILVDGRKRPVYQKVGFFPFRMFFQQLRHLFFSYKINLSGLTVQLIADPFSNQLRPFIFLQGFYFIGIRCFSKFHILLFFI